MIFEFGQWVKSETILAGGFFLFAEPTVWLAKNGHAWSILSGDLKKKDHWFILFHSNSKRLFSGEIASFIHNAYLLWNIFVCVCCTFPNISLNNDDNGQNSKSYTVISTSCTPLHTKRISKDIGKGVGIVLVNCKSK